jgi:outer membrane protein assembly factor BamB
VSATYRSDASAEPVLAAFNGKIFALDAVSGRRLWSWDSGVSAVVRLGFDGAGRVYALVRKQLVCLELASGSVQWTVEADIGDTLLVAGGLILVGGLGEVACFSRDGNRVWNDELKGHGIGDVALAHKGLVAQADRQS